MKTIYIYILALISSVFISTSSIAQATAMDFQTVDCNGNNIHLFSDLDAGQAIVLFFYMPSCGTCPPPAQEIQAMANKINATCPGMVKGYANSYLNSTSCTYTAGWVVGNNLPMYVPMGGDGADQVAYYGGFGMPTVVLLGGGSNHDVLWSTQNYVSSDTTVMRDLILAMNCVAGTNELENENATLDVFPNPTSDFMHVKFTTEVNTEIYIEVVDLTGKIVLPGTIEKSETGNIERTIDISGLPIGSYLVKITENGIITTRQIAIVH